MWHIGVDLHRRTVVIAAVTDKGKVFDPVTIPCKEEQTIVRTFKKLTPFRAVIEASATYRWLHDLVSPHGTVLLAHPLKLRAMIQRRSKTDKLDSMLLAQLLRINQVPLSYIPSERYQYLRDVTRYRVRLGRDRSQLKVDVQLLLARNNRYAPYKDASGVRGRKWLSEQDFDLSDNYVRDDLIERLDFIDRKIYALDERIEKLREDYPELDSLLGIHGMGVYTGLLVIGELGDVERFRRARQVGAYTGLTARINQSGGHCYHGHITKQGSNWLRWALVQVAVKVVRRDAKLSNFYNRIRKRSSSKIARVAVARKLAEICWKRLRSWHRRNAD